MWKLYLGELSTPVTDSHNHRGHHHRIPSDHSKKPDPGGLTRTVGHRVEDPPEEGTGAKTNFRVKYILLLFIKWMDRQTDLNGKCSH